jgi:NAD(P)-dependent dehydrogenase (short-subunit alcohol dehydrogenase family)
MTEALAMSMEFESQVGIVTGAARGLGRSTARLVAQRGASVVLVDRDSETLQHTVEAMRADGLDVRGLVADLAEEEDVARLREDIERTGGRLDFLINNAGGWRYGRANEISLSDWEWTFRTNVTAAFLTTRSVMDLMVSRTYGRIVNIASTDAHRPKPTLPHYAAAKAALVSLTRSLAEELAPSQVIVNAVSPGAIATETAKSQDWITERIKSIPLGRAAEPEDIAEVVLFLASPRNRFVVGQTVLANGGMLMA